MEAIPFQARARTIDHLGREQIADCPTAISELWKNAYDAYARNVELVIYDTDELVSDTPVATIFDDGHGMNKEEFISKWLVIGTESKTLSSKTPIPDRNGLKERPRQGQKGIGRLSCANIAPLLLIVSKRKNNDFIASLLDWRLFENPYLNLSDIRIPVVEFSEVNQVIAHIPGLFEQLFTNLSGERNNESDDASSKNSKEAHKQRIESAWRLYDDAVLEDAKNDINFSMENYSSPSSEIEGALVDSTFDITHFSDWPVWNGKSESGTILLMSDLHLDLKAQLVTGIPDAVEADSINKFQETLSSFIDPFAIGLNGLKNVYKGEFNYGAYKVINKSKSVILNYRENFSTADVKDMEHIVDGEIDLDGVFCGKIKAFGIWHEDVKIRPPNDVNIPSQINSKLGRISLFIASMEFRGLNSTHSPGEMARYSELASKFSGMMLHRDGLRVMPFGRTESDFFGIEQRRSLRAGTEFWNHRQMFGSISISRDGNPNLKDKAGREGLLDNVAAKTFRSLMINLFKYTARNYFGSESDVRQELLPKINSYNTELRAESEKIKFRARQRKAFRFQLKKDAPAIAKLSNTLEDFVTSIVIDSEETINIVQTELEIYRERLREFKLGVKPSNLSDENKRMYVQFQDDKNNARVLIQNAQINIDKVAEEISRLSPKAYLEQKITTHKSILGKSSKKYSLTIKKLQKAEFDRISELIESRSHLYGEQIIPVQNKLLQGDINLEECLKIVEKIRYEIEDENEQLFEPYINALESLKESIDLETLATFGIEQVSEMRREIDRLNSLAQLGIAIEIVSHELQSYDTQIAVGMRNLPTDLQSTSAYKSIKSGYEGLTDQLRFLSPLKLSGEKSQGWLTGEDIFNYIQDFFEQIFERNKITFEATQDFKNFKIYEETSRLYPVFINLINNSSYWVSQNKKAERKILLSVKDKHVFVSDNGPGVEAIDIDRLFSLFFTRRQSGGRGVGLYLCRANLSPGGHKIEYDNSEFGVLSGANFSIKFKGAQFV